MRVSHLDLDARPFPFLLLPGEHTKNGDPAKLLLVPKFAEELRQWIADFRKQPEDLLFAERIEMVKNLKNDLKAAGIPFKDAAGKVVDFHALRHTAGTMLGIAGVPARIRMFFSAWHGDIRPHALQTYVMLPPTRWPKQCEQWNGSTCNNSTHRGQPATESTNYGVSAQIRMLFIRHSDIRLTTRTYDDTTSRGHGREIIPAQERVDLQ